MAPFGWFGGKWYQLSFILPLLPHDASSFVDVFGGSGVVTLNVKPYPVMTWNDLHGDLVNFFRVLRERPLALVRALRLTPYAHEELDNAAVSEDGLTDLERARRFYVLARMSWPGTFGRSVPRWKYVTNKAGVDTKVSNAREMITSVEKLHVVAQRWRSVQIENRPAAEVIAKHDGPGTLFYLDPPYVARTRVDKMVYKHEMSDDDHRALAETLHGIKGRAVLSGYRSDLYDEIYADWCRMDDIERPCHARIRIETKTTRRESAWLNFDPKELPQPDLFHHEGAHQS